MKYHKRFTKKLVLFIAGFVALVVCAFLCFPLSTDNKKDTEVSAVETVEKTTADQTNQAYIKRATEQPEYFVGMTEDDVILLKWKTPVENVTLVIAEGRTGENVLEIIKDLKGTGEYRFTTGNHGTRYTFKLEYPNIWGMITAKILRRMFLDFDQLPGIELWRIDTENGEEPTFKKAEKKHGQDWFGMTIKNNEYEQAVLNDNIPMKIRVRGNSSAFITKKSYKIVFTENKDMLGLGEEYADKEWILLGKNSYLQTYFGLELGRAVGMEWEPRMRFINVILNGDWKGLYILCESIKPHPKRVALKEDGFLIESDAYFWKEEAPVFDTPYISNRVKFTFKYPKVTSDSDERFLAIKQRMMAIDDVLQHGSDDVENMVDFDTTAAWLLAHELMGTTDGFGSNKFFYQTSMSEDSKLKMGPLWDFDSMFRDNLFFKWTSEDHSSFVVQNTTYIPRLLSNDNFRDAYKKKYFEVVPTIEKTMREAMNKLKDIAGLENNIGSEDGKIYWGFGGFEDAIDNLLNHLHKRIVWLEKEMKAM